MKIDQPSSEGGTTSTGITLDPIFLNFYNISGEVMGIVKSVPLVPLMTQVAWSHIDTWI